MLPNLLQKTERQEEIAHQPAAKGGRKKTGVRYNLHCSLLHALEHSNASYRIEMRELKSTLQKTRETVEAAAAAAARRGARRAALIDGAGAAAQGSL